MTTDRDDEEVIGRMLAGEPARDDAEAELRAPYERLVTRLREFDGATLPAGWDERAALRLQAARAREARDARRRWLRGGVVAVAIAAAVMLIVWTRGEQTARPSAPTSRVAVVIRTVDGVERRGDAAVGDFLQARVDSRRAHVELRLYRDATVVARCPGEVACDGQHLRYPLSAPGRYQVVALESDTPLPEPTVGGLDEDVLAVERSGGRAQRQEPTLVMP